MYWSSILTNLRLNLEASISNNLLETNIAEATRIKTNLSTYLNLLHTPYDGIGLTPYIVLGEVLNRFEEVFHHLPHEEKYLEINQDRTWVR